MVENHYRWDFIGLSTDVKPTPETSEKVVDGSTFYCSDTSKLYVYCKDNWYERKPLGGGGGGTTYTAGAGIDITEDTISIDDDVVATLQELNARIDKGEGAPTTATEGVVGGLYEDNTNGKLYICTAITAGTDPDPDTYTWEEVGAGGGGVTPVQTTGTSTTDVMSQNATTNMVYSPKQTSTYDNWGAVYIGNKNSHNEVIIDPSTTDTHESYFYALPSTTTTPKSRGVCILGSITSGQGDVAIGQAATANKNGSIAIGISAHAEGLDSVGIGDTVDCNKNYSVALGSYASPTRVGEVNVGTGSSAVGYNSTYYRVIGGVHDGQDAQDAVTVNQVNGVIDAINTALSTNIPHIGTAS